MQLSLPIHQIDDETLDNFYAENSLSLLDSLHHNFHEVYQPFFYIWGGKSSGKSHLLKALCNHYLLSGKTTGYIPLEKSTYFSPAVLDNAEQLDLFCLDDVQAIVGDEMWEQAIFDLFNQFREQQGLFSQGKKTLLIISADRPPNLLGITREDLSSRLMWGEVHHLSDMSDEQKRVILQRKAYGKGLELSEDIANFLLKRVSRDLQVLQTKLDLLDRASLQAKHKLTLPFVKSVLGF